MQPISDYCLAPAIWVLQKLPLKGIFPDPEPVRFSKTVDCYEKRIDADAQRNSNEMG